MIIGCYGGMSSGKTLTAAKIAKEYYDNGYSIFSNINLLFPYLPLDTDHIEKYMTGEIVIEKCVFLIDEMYLFIDSRLGGSKQSKLYSYFALQTSKKSIVLVYTAQQKHSVDKRIRDNTHREIHCFPLLKHKTRNKYADFTNRDNRLIPFDFQDRFYIGHIIIYHNPFKCYKELIYAKDYFGLYDTKEIVKFNIEKLKDKPKKRG
jgi:hypothetical protein